MSIVLLLLSLIAMGLAIAGTLAAVLTRQSVQTWRARIEALEAGNDGLRRELQMVAAISARAGRQVQRVEQEYSSVAERVDLVESRGAAMPGSLDDAISWARRGVGAGELAQQFGLTSAEAELVSRLHGAKKSA
jgi:hypothetical protein